MKIKKIKTQWGDKIQFKGKYARGDFYYDGSGYLETTSKDWFPNNYYCCESGTHKMRASDIKKLAKFYAKVAKELDQLEIKLGKTNK